MAAVVLGATAACGSPVTAEPPPAPAAAPAAGSTTGDPPAGPAADGGGETAAQPTPTRTQDEAPRPPAAVASPIRVPLPTDELQGSPVDRAVDDLTAAIRRACGGEVCLSIALSVLTEEEAGDIWPCETVRSVVGLQREESEDGNRPFVTVASGGTITLVVSGACPPGGAGADPSGGSPAPLDGASGAGLGDDGAPDEGTASTGDRSAAPSVPVDASPSS